MSVGAFFQVVIFVGGLAVIFVSGLVGFAHYANKLARWLNPKHGVSRVERRVDGPSKRETLEQAQIALSEEKPQTVLLTGQVETLRFELAEARATIDKRDAAISNLYGHLNALDHQLNVAKLEAEEWAQAFATQEEQLAQGIDDGRFRRLRTLILKELHPDHAAPGSADRAIRGEVFKAIWPKMEELERAP